MKQYINRKALVLIACLVPMVLSLGYSVSGTLAEPSDFTESFSNPYPAAYNRTIEVGAKYTMPTVTQAYTWVNADDTVLAMSYWVDLAKPSLYGIKPGVSIVAAGTQIGQVAPYRFLVVDSTNITSYTLAGGAEGHIQWKNNTLNIPVTTVPAGSASKIKWTSLNSAIATVSGATVKAVADAGAAVILGKFTDPWGLEHAIPYLVVVGGGSGSGPDPHLIEGLDGNWYWSLNQPAYIYEALGENGVSKAPPEYVYSPDGIPGNYEDRKAYSGVNGSFWAEDADNSDIWQEITSPGGDGLMGMANMGLVLDRERGHILLPLRYAETLGYTVSWNQTTNTVELEKNGVKLEFVPEKDKTKAKLYEQGHLFNRFGYLDFYYADILYGDVYVSLNFIADLLQCEVGWDKASSQIKIAEKGEGIDTNFFRSNLYIAYVNYQLVQDNEKKEQCIREVGKYHPDKLPDVMFAFNNTYYGSIFTYMEMNHFFKCKSMEVIKDSDGYEWLIYYYNTIKEADKAVLMLCGWRTVRYAEFNYIIHRPSTQTIKPYTATYTIGDPPIQFNAIDFIDILGVGNRAVIWTLDKTGATISITGSFTATVAGTYTITAASKDDGTKRATATVTVIDP